MDDLIKSEFRQALVELAIASSRHHRESKHLSLFQQLIELKAPKQGQGRQILQLILFLLKKLALPGSGEAVDLVSEVDLGESVYRVDFEAVDSVSEAAASRPYSLLSRLLLN